MKKFAIWFSVSYFMLCLLVAGAAESRADIVTVPADVSEIEEEAFAGAGMTAVKCPDGLQQIGARAFADCPQLERVYIPESVSAIADDAFAGCEGLTAIYGAAGSCAEELAEQLGCDFYSDFLMH